LGNGNIAHLFLYLRVYWSFIVIIVTRFFLGRARSGIASAVGMATIQNQIKLCENKPPQGFDDEVQERL